MSKVRLKVSLEIEHEDLSDETLRAVENCSASFAEQLEALWTERLAHLKKQFPDLTFTTSNDDDEGEEWKG